MYICGRGGYNSWSHSAYHFDTLVKKKSIFFMMYANFLNKPLFWGVPTDHLGRVLQVFINKAF